MKLLTASASPFANKVRMAAHLSGIELEAISINAAEQPAELKAANPLGKIPCLILDNGEGLFDNRPIARYFDRLSGGKLYPSEADALLSAERFEALCDGVCDCAVAWQYEKRMRPEEKWHQPWLDSQWTKATDGLKVIEKELPELGDKADIKALSLAATLGYLALRFDGLWESDFPKLVEWAAKFDATHPEIAQYKPSA